MLNISPDSNDVLSPPSLIKSAKSRFASIDGLRGLACLFVVALHCYTLAGEFPTPFSFDKIFCNIAYSGVDLFFLLSGFCLAYPILKRGGTRFNWRSYIWKRASRIFPPYWCTLIICLFVSKIIYIFNVPLLSNTPSLTWNVPPSQFFQYLLLIRSNEFILSSWTLPLEWRWYFILPAFLFLLVRLSSLYAIMLSILISILCVPVLQSPNVPLRISLVLTQMPIYLPTFVAGLWVADLIIKKRKSELELIFVKHSHWFLLASMIACYLENPKWNVPSTRVIAWMPIFFFLTISVIFNIHFKRVFEWQPLVKTGEFSYSLYLIHELPLKIAHTIEGHLNIPDDFKWLFYQFLIFPCLIAIGYIFFKLVEEPLLSWSRKYKLGTE